MEISTAWRPVGRGGSSPSPAYFYMMDNLLESRKDNGYPPNSDFFDEDVNVYLASLLTSRIYGGLDPSGSCVEMDYDIHLFETLNRTADPRTRFRSYRMAANAILLGLGVFDNPAGRRPGSAAHMAMTNGAWAGRGSAYYRLAWAAAAETFRRPTAIGDVMGKLSTGFERYARVLSSMRSSCLNMLPSLSDGELFHLGRKILEDDRKKELSALYDSFLDAWNDYRSEGSPAAMKKLEERCAELRKADPSFEFEAIDTFEGPAQTPLIKSPQ